MTYDKVQHVKSWVERANREQNLQLTPKEVHKAAEIGAETWVGLVGVGQAAENGIAAVKKLRE